MHLHELIIDEHALKHGLDPDDIETAWFNFMAKQYRGAPREGQVVVIGYDSGGRCIEMVGTERSFGTVVFHALTPPTEKILKELGMKG